LGTVKTGKGRERTVQDRERQEWDGKEQCRICRDSVEDGKDRIGTAETGMGRERTVQNM
jgi:hypothetical protein